MTTRDELYAKFGITAEAAQLFETELGTLLLFAHALQHGWHVKPDGASARAVLDDIERSTLGRLISTLKKHAGIDDGLAARFQSALEARNKLNHGFYERHNFRIQTDEGRQLMFDDLESLHDELFEAWQIACTMTQLANEAMADLPLPKVGSEHTQEGR